MHQVVTGKRTTATYTLPYNREGELIGWYGEPRIKNSRIGSPFDVGRSLTHGGGAYHICIRRPLP